ncbi:TIM barrel protein [Acuticoccus sp. I52.16.1]|uniref:TIM barrel protein n=1 Tax=Acuticoccus sp. I52.16.1 TaxID=2928472 RepID=UPI001FD3EA70|nr:TIM barrel protein [Acuticoccus sp. I52.16.1]UOM32940.1 TIM barrel protein [Acuticoccus sp. I52.16.1]
MIFSANIAFLWTDRPFLERFAAARAAGFTVVEFHDQAQLEGPQVVREALGDLTVAGINAHMGETAGVAAIPGREAEARAQIAEAIAAARTVGAAAVHVVSGVTQDADRHRRLADRLAEAAADAPDLTLLVEPLCEAAKPGYAVNSVEEASRVVRLSGAPNVKIMFDCFHVQRQSGDVLTRFRDHFDEIGHVQIAGGLTRQEPDRGELDYAFLLPAFVEAGYTGAFGCEYTPATTVEAGLGWRDVFTRPTGSAAG